MRCFFFQAEDGIRDPLVTGVQTCALPISDDYGEAPVGEAARACIVRARSYMKPRSIFPPGIIQKSRNQYLPPVRNRQRSEERRVGKECRSRRVRGYGKKNN